MKTSLISGDKKDFNICNEIHDTKTGSHIYGVYITVPVKSREEAAGREHERSSG